jgi:DNA-binding NtrC family response regulator
LQGLTASAMARLIDYHWPGNVRELGNVVERAAILARGPVLELEEWSLPASDERQKSAGRLSRLAQPVETRAEPSNERDVIEAALTASRGRVSGPSGAAAKLRIPASTLEHKIKALKINKSRFKFG